MNPGSRNHELSQRGLPPFYGSQERLGIASSDAASPIASGSPRSSATSKVDEGTEQGEMAQRQVSQKQSDSPTQSPLTEAEINMKNLHLVQESQFCHLCFGRIQYMCMVVSMS